MGGRPPAGDYEDEAPWRRGRREDHHDDLAETEDKAVFEDEAEERLPRRKVAHKHQAHRAEEDEDEEEDDTDDDHHGKQLMVRSQKKKKSTGKEVARIKKHETSDEESSSEEEKKAKKKAKKKSNARKSEMITKAAWEPVPRDEMDQYFVDLICDELEHRERKIWDCVDDEQILRHTETGEYNIDACFEEGAFSVKDKKRWKQAVSKLKTNINKAEILFCSAIAKSAGPGYGPSYGPIHGPSRPTRTAAVYMPAAEVRGHRHYNPRCHHCDECGVGCAVLFSDYYGY
ncbi:MAG: hypothetical protein Q9188_000376 [Gyalolechia gomerana]